MEIKKLDCDYEGIAKVLLAFVELYKVAPDPKVIDKAFFEFSIGRTFIPPFDLTPSTSQIHSPTKLKQ